MHDHKRLFGYSFVVHCQHAWQEDAGQFPALLKAAPQARSLIQNVRHIKQTLCISLPLKKICSTVDIESWNLLPSSCLTCISSWRERHSFLIEPANDPVSRRSKSWRSSVVGIISEPHFFWNQALVSLRKWEQKGLCGCGYIIHSIKDITCESLIAIEKQLTNFWPSLEIVAISTDWLAFQ